MFGRRGPEGTFVEDCSSPFMHIYEVDSIVYMNRMHGCTFPNHILKRQDHRDPRDPVAYMYDKITPFFRQDMQEWHVRCDAMREYFRLAPALPDPLPDAPERLCLDHMLGPLDTDTYNGMRNAITRSLKLRREFSIVCQYLAGMSDAVRVYMHGIIDMSIVVGHHVVNDICELIERAATHTVKIMYPYFVVYLYVRSRDNIRDTLDKYNDSSDVTRCDIPSILRAIDQLLWRRAQIIREAPLRRFVALRITIVHAITDTDGLNDMLDRDGWTPEHIAFARDQITEERSVMSRTFRDFLATRPDWPECLLIM